jgi:hypothetical protein
LGFHVLSFQEKRRRIGRLVKMKRRETLCVPMMDLLAGHADRGRVDGSGHEKSPRPGTPGSGL